MKTAIYNRYGGADAVEIHDLPRPRPGPKDVLVRVVCASINPVDWKILKGEQQIFTGRRFPRRIGSDFAGVVEEVGTRVRDMKPGLRVFGMQNPLIGGALGEYLAVPEAYCAPLPDSVSFAAGAAMPAAGITALRCYRGYGRVQPRDRVLVNGASGGVGTFAVQLARLSGCHVTGVCSTRNLDLARAIGCHEVVDYRKTSVLDLESRFERIIDVAGTLGTSRVFRLLSQGGALVVVNVPNRRVIPTALKSLLPGRRIRIFLATPRAADLATLAHLAEQDRLTAVIDSVTAFGELRSALARSVAGQVRGKLVVAVSEESPG